MMASTGRMSLLESVPGLQDQVLVGLRLGLHDNRVCEMVGLSTKTFYEWLSRGEGRSATRASNALFVDFAEAVKKARAESQAHHLMNIRRAADAGTWQASAWYLERRYPDEWGRRDPQVEVSAEVTMDVDYQGRIRARMLAVVARAAEVEAGRTPMGERTEPSDEDLDTPP